MPAVAVWLSRAHGCRALECRWVYLPKYKHQTRTSCYQEASTTEGPHFSKRTMNDARKYFINTEFPSELEQNQDTWNCCKFSSCLVPSCTILFKIQGRCPQVFLFSLCRDSSCTFPSWRDASLFSKMCVFVVWIWHTWEPHSSCKSITLHYGLMGKNPLENRTALQCYFLIAHFDFPFL